MRKIASMPPLQEDDFRTAVGSVADVGDFFERYVEGTDPLPYADLFATAGIEFRTQPRSESSLGATFRVDNGKLLVASVLRGGAGMEAGLLPGDELIAVNGTRTSSEGDVNLLMRMTKPAELLVTRGGVVRQMSAAVKADPRVRVTLTVREESPLRRAWLSQ
jgi:predicted metalloprotease with PDZ domain